MKYSVRRQDSKRSCLKSEPVLGRSCGLSCWATPSLAIYTVAGPLSLCTHMEILTTSICLLLDDEALYQVNRHHNRIC